LNQAVIVSGWGSVYCVVDDIQDVEPSKVWPAPVSGPLLSVVNVPLATPVLPLPEASANGGRLAAGTLPV
jgi:hypothetical protein